MFSRVTIRVSDPDASAAFYAAALAGLIGDPDGLPSAQSTDPPDPSSAVLDAADLVFTASDLVIARATTAAPTTRQLHVGLVAASPEHVDRFWRAGTEAGFASDGEPGPRPQYAADYYGGFLLDPDGNSIEAVHHGALREGGLIDHLWVRVRNAGLTRRFYEATAAQAGGSGDAEPGYRLVAGEEKLARFRGSAGGSLTVIEGLDPTVGLDLQIGAARFLDPDGRSLRLRAAPAT